VIYTITGGVPVADAPQPVRGQTIQGTAATGFFPQQVTEYNDASLDVDRIYTGSIPNAAPNRPHNFQTRTPPIT